MVLSKSISVFDPETVAQRILLIGCGATGSILAVQLAKMGVTNIEFFDDDIVEEKNVNNQMFSSSHVGKPKVTAMYDILKDINAAFSPEQFHQEKFLPGTHNKWLSQKTIIYLCVDHGRKSILEFIMRNPNVDYIIETRIGVDSLDVYKVTKDKKLREMYMDTVPTLEKELNPTELSPCGEVMSIFPGITVCAAYAAQLLRYLDGDIYNIYAQLDGPNFGVITTQI